MLNIERIEGVPGHEDGIAGFDLCPITQELADAAGAQFVTDEASAIEPEGDGWKVTAGSMSYAAPALILAMGAHPVKLGVPGEAQFVGKGVSHCATCDGPLLRGKIAVVAGGGDSGMQEALTLSAHVLKVLMIERSDELTGQACYVEQVEADPKIEVLTGREVTAIEGGEKVEKVRLKDVASGEESAIEAQGFFRLHRPRADARSRRGDRRLRRAGAGQGGCRSAHEREGHIRGGQFAQRQQLARCGRDGRRRDGRHQRVALLCRWRLARLTCKVA